jgi:hypothetical protein
MFLAELALARELTPVEGEKPDVLHRDPDAQASLLFGNTRFLKEAVAAAQASGTQTQQEFFIGLRNNLGYSFNRTDKLTLSELDSHQRKFLLEGLASLPEAPSGNETVGLFFAEIAFSKPDFLPDARAALIEKGSQQIKEAFVLEASPTPLLTTYRGEPAHRPDLINMASKADEAIRGVIRSMARPEVERVAIGAFDKRYGNASRASSPKDEFVMAAARAELARRDAPSVLLQLD